MLIAKKILVIGVFGSFFPHNILADYLTTTQNSSQKSFSKLALGQSAALCGFGAITNAIGKDIHNCKKSIIPTKRWSLENDFNTLKFIGKTSMGLGFLSGMYVLISMHKMKQRS